MLLFFLLLASSGSRCGCDSSLLAGVAVAETKNNLVVVATERCLYARIAYLLEQWYR